MNTLNKHEIEKIGLAKKVVAEEMKRLEEFESPEEKLKNIMIFGEYCKKIDWEMIDDHPANNYEMTLFEEFELEVDALVIAAHEHLKKALDDKDNSILDVVVENYEDYDFVAEGIDNYFRDVYYSIMTRERK
ncbi:hypothetical protein AB3A32_002600 [Vibrio alginolyticus]